MELTSSVLLTLFLIPFWAAVFSFCPVIIYLIFHPLYSIRADAAAKKNIFLLTEEMSLKKERARRLNGVTVIYGVCFWLVIFISFINWVGQGKFSVQPFDILSSASVILMCFAILTYLPFAIYLIIKDPWRYKQQGAVFTKISMLYGAGICLFSLLFSGVWLNAKHFFFSAFDLIKFLFVLFFSSTIIAYIPILFYAFWSIKNPFRSKPLKMHIAFLIYCICLFCFSIFYIWEWYQKYL